MLEPSEDAIADTPEEPAALAYIEKALSDAYRKEIDQEENVWRSLPFFAATLALQLAALFQTIDKVPGPGTRIGLVSIILIGAAGMLTLTSLVCLAISIYPQKFEYIAKQGDLLGYALELIDGERNFSLDEHGEPLSALVTLKLAIARQYAQATDHNQRINKRRERWRSIAGLGALGSVLMTVFLVAAAYAHYLSTRSDKEIGHAAHQAVAGQHASAGAGFDARGQAHQPASAVGAADAGGDQGVVGAARGVGTCG